MRAALLTGSLMMAVIAVGACEAEESAICTREEMFDIWDQCPDAQPRRCVGRRSDGRVDISAAEAWPERAEEPPPLTPEQTADACAALASCDDFQFETVRGSALLTVTPYTLLTSCLAGGLNGYSTEERAIPIDGYDERLGFLLRAVLAKNGDCAAIRTVLTRSRVNRECQEDGCWVNGEPPRVHCEGDVAVFDNGSRRDCSRAYARCAVSSPTGCTDRPLLGCPVGASDRCDGNVKLGCDSCGYVTFRDCGWSGGRCVQTAEGAVCEDAARECDTIPACEGNSLMECVSGKAMAVDCTRFGATCRSRTITVELERGAGGPPASVPSNPADPDTFNCVVEAILTSGANGGEIYQCTRARCVRP